MVQIGPMTEENKRAGKTAEGMDERMDMTGAF